MRLVSPLFGFLLRGGTVAAAFVILAGGVPLSSMDWCQPAKADHHRHHSRNYGSDGYDGANGQDGRDGRSGDSQTIRANGTPVNLNLSGDDGEDGQDGQQAGHPVCLSQRREVAHDIHLPDGGNGGSGGDGGAGGNGGDLTVYYTDPAQLRQIYVTAEGGRGGRSGRGASGTDGCDCYDRRWTIETCQDGTCTSEEYRCYSGADGSQGSTGQRGEDGRLGRLTLINRDQTIPSETPTRSVAISTFSDQPVTLSRNLWESRSGANALLAPGSRVDSTYSEYVGHVEGDFQLVWASEQVAQANAPGELGLAIDPDGRVNVTSPDDLWVGGELSHDGRLTTFRATGAVWASDATQLALGRTDGRSRSFELNVLDLAQQSDLVETEFYIRYRTRRDGGRSRYTTRYEGQVAPEWVTQDHNRFTLAVGRLPISGQQLSEGTLAEVELVVIRSYAGKSAQQVLTWRGKI